MRSRYYLLVFVLFAICTSIFSSVQSDSVQCYLRLTDKLKMKSIEDAVGDGVKALNYATSIGSKRGGALANKKLGELYLLQLKFEKAKISIESALNYFKESNEKDLYSQTLLVLGNYYEKLGNYNKALENYTSAFEYFKISGNVQGQKSAYNNIGTIYYATAEENKALSFYTLAFSLDSIGIDTTVRKDILANIGTIYYDLGKFDSALVFFEKVKKIEKTRNDSLGLGKTLNSIGSSFLAKNNIYEAHKFLVEGLNVSKKVGDKHTLSSLYCNLGMLALQKDDQDLALEYFDSCEVIASENNVIDVLLNVYYQKSKIFELEKDFKHALSFYQLYEELRQSILVKKGFISETETLLLKQRNENEILRLEKAEQKRKTLIVLLLSLLTLAVLSSSSILYISQLRQKGKLETALSEIQKQQFQAVIEAQERERKRIASDLHDSVGQMLSLTKLRMSDLLDNISSINDEYKYDVERTIKVIDEACQEVRQISHNLMPGSLIRLGFVAATKDLVRKVNQNGKLAVDFKVINIEERLEEKIEVALYRILQEILNNAIKHSNADKMYIVLGRENNAIELNVRDNGVGFDTKNINSNIGIGWKNINSRLAVVNGKININSESGKGVHIQLRVPA